MAEGEIANGGSGDDVARLVALTDRQHELWALLRDAEDEQVRNQLFDELTSNREELARLKKVVSDQVEPVPPPNSPEPQPEGDVPRSVGEQLRSKILAPAEGIAPAEPPPPPSPPPPQAPAAPQPPIPAAAPTPPSTPEPAPDPVPVAPPVEDIPESVPAVERVEDPETPDELVSDTRLAPEDEPFNSREADLAAMKGEPQQAQPQPAEPPQAQSVADGILEERRRSAHEAYQEIERVRPAHARSFPVFAILVAIAAVAVVAWYLFFFNQGGETAPAPASTTTTLAAAPDAGPGEQIQAVVDGMGVGTIMVEERDGTIYLFGAVGSEADRTAIIGASQALAEDLTVDSAGLTLNIGEEDLRSNALQAIADAGFDKINVAVSGGVATLTGVTPESGTEDLVAAVLGIEGIAQVVDLTESSDRAEALEDELSRVTAVTPIVFESGQVAPNELHERILDRVAEIVLAYNGPIITIVGYTDASGSDEENERISRLRGERVRDYLIAQGVPAERLVVEGRGESDASGAAAVAGLERRVEFEVGYAVPAGGDADFRIGIVAPSARNDLAFTQSIVDAADVIAAERGGVGIDISDGLFVPEDAEAAIRAYAADGYDLVIAHGSQYGT